MKRQEKLELLLEIEEAIQHFEEKIDAAAWSNEFGYGQEFKYMYEKNTNDIHTYKMCIDRLNERFTKQLFAIRESQIKNK
jgi:peptide subunit release factor RF-3